MKSSSNTRLATSAGARTAFRCSSRSSGRTSRGAFRRSNSKQFSTFHSIRHDSKPCPSTSTSICSSYSAEHSQCGSRFQKSNKQTHFLAPNLGSTMAHNLHSTLKEFDSGSGKGKFYSLPELGKALNVKIERLPVSIRIVLESVLRNFDGKKVAEEHVGQLANWK